MAAQFNPIYTVRYDTQVKETYVAKAKLMNCVRVQPMIEATSFVFKRIGTAMATQYAQAEIVTDSGTKTYNSTAYMTEWKDSDIIGEEELRKVDVDSLLSKYSDKQAGAVQRLIDQLILNTWNNVTSANPTGGGNLSLTSGVEQNTIRVLLGDGTQPANPNPANNNYQVAEGKKFDSYGFKKAWATLMQNGLENNNDVFIALSAAQWNTFLDDQRVTNIFYVNEKPLVSGHIADWLGIHILVIDGRPETGLLPVSFASAGALDGRRIYMWEKESTGLATLETIETKIWQEGMRYDAWVAWTKTSAGATIIDPNGIVCIVANNY